MLFRFAPPPPRLPLRPTWTGPITTTNRLCRCRHEFACRDGGARDRTGDYGARYSCSSAPIPDLFSDRRLYFAAARTRAVRGMPCTPFRMWRCSGYSPPGAGWRRGASFGRSSCTSLKQVSQEPVHTCGCARLEAAQVRSFAAEFIRIRKQVGILTVHRQMIDRCVVSVRAVPNR